VGEVGVVVAGVGDELPEAVGESCQQGIECDPVEGAGGEDADCALGGGEAFFGDNAEEFGAEGAEDLDLGAAEPSRLGRGADGPGGFEGVTDGADAGFAGGAEDRAQNLRKHVGVFVGVDVGEMQASVLQEGDLGGGFGFDLLPDLAGG